MGSKQPSTTTQISKVELPAWVEAASADNYNFAKNVAKTPYKRYTGERVAGLSELEQAAGGTLQAGMDASNAAFAGAAGIGARAGGYNPMMVNGPGNFERVTAPSFLQGDIQAYMDPEINNVVNLTEQGQRRGINLQAQGASDAARGAGAFGGSRHAITEAVLRNEGENSIALNSAGLRSNAFNNAASRLMQDNQSALQAALANQNAGLTTEQMRIGVDQGNQNADLAGAGIRLQGGSLLSQVGQQYSDTAGRNALLQTQIGANERSVEQARLDQKYQDWYDRTHEREKDLNIRLAALGMSPYGKTQTTTSTQPNNSNNLMTGIGAAATILPLLFSDRKVKKNVKKVGKTDNDLNVYEFEYKKGFGIGGKQTGLMAQDVEKKVPGAVHNVNVNGTSVKAVDYAKAVSTPRNGRDDRGKPRAPYKPRVGIGGRARAA